MKQLALLALPLLIATASHAQDIPGLPQPPIPVSEGVRFPTYAPARIGDIAPEFALPDKSGKLWSSRDQLGQHAIVMVFIGQAPVLTGKGVTPTAVLSSVAQAAETLQKSEVSTVVISQVTGIELSGLNAQFDALNLRDEKGELNRYYGASATFLTVVGIDRAGFVRRIETVRDPSQVGAVMQAIGDTTPMVEEGKAAPDFAITDMNGRVWNLEELRGRKNLILSFFPKCFTGGCANHLSSLQEQQAAFEANDTQTLGVSVDAAGGERGQLAFAQLQGITYPLLPDVGRNLSILYGAARRSYSLDYRRTFLIDKNGVLRFVDKNINVFTHGADVLAKMRELGLAK